MIIKRRDWKPLNGKKLNSKFPMVRVYHLHGSILTLQITVKKSNIPKIFYTRFRFAFGSLTQSISSISSQPSSNHSSFIALSFILANVPSFLLIVFSSRIDAWFFWQSDPKLSQYSPFLLDSNCAVLFSSLVSVLSNMLHSARNSSSLLSRSASNNSFKLRCFGSYDQKT